MNLLFTAGNPMKPKGNAGRKESVAVRRKKRKLKRKGNPMAKKRRHKKARKHSPKKRHPQAKKHNPHKRRHM